MALPLNRILSGEHPGRYEPMLASLQANIIKAHVRDHLGLLLLTFPGRAEGRDFLARLADPAPGFVKSALEHLPEARRHRRDRTPGTTYVGVGLTYAGYAALGVHDAPKDPAFRQGMRHPDTRERLHDPAVSTWDAAYRDQLHALVIVADATPEPVAARRSAVLALAESTGVRLVGTETGLGHRNANGDGIEHFGYVDGRSQPLFLKEDIEAEAATGPAVPNWDPAFPLDRILVPDPAAPDPGVHHGSYLVLRKLEQNVEAFEHAEDQLAADLRLAKPDADRAGALIVGRFEDGTPVTLHGSAQGAERPGTYQVPNDFNYTADADGSRCPFQAHIRTMNPRLVPGGPAGDRGPGPGAVRESRRHVMARRGQTYGRRRVTAQGGFAEDDKPTGGVGLLFLAFNVDIGQQFEHVQRAANGTVRADGAEAGPARPDPVIGQCPARSLEWPRAWGRPEVEPAPAIPPAVTMKGGDYFFVPSIAFLRSLAGPA